jgi:hypothetical protein
LAEATHETLVLFSVVLAASTLMGDRLRLKFRLVIGSSASEHEASETAARPIRHKVNILDVFIVSQFY